MVWLPFFIFPSIGNHHPNWRSYFSEGFKPPTSFIWLLVRVVATFFFRVPLGCRWIPRPSWLGTGWNIFWKCDRTKRKGDCMGKTTVTHIWALVSQLVHLDFFSIACFRFYPAAFHPEILSHSVDAVPWPTSNTSAWMWADRQQLFRSDMSTLLFRVPLGFI